MVDELGVVLRADACQVKLRSASGMPRRSKVFLMSSGTDSQSLLVGVGLDVGDDVIHVQALDGGAPRRIREAVEDLEGL